MFLIKFLIKFSRTFDVEKIYFIKLNLFQENFSSEKKNMNAILLYYRELLLFTGNNFQVLKQNTKIKTRWLQLRI